MTTTYRISQINAETSNCSYEHERRSMVVYGDSALDMKRQMWREEIRATPMWGSDWIRVREVR